LLGRVRRAADNQRGDRVRDTDHLRARETLAQPPDGSAAIVFRPVLGPGAKAAQGFGARVPDTAVVVGQRRNAGLSKEGSEAAIARGWNARAAMDDGDMLRAVAGRGMEPAGKL